jgi:hypothetical protein
MTQTTHAGYIVHSNETIDGTGATADEAWADFRRTMEQAGIDVLPEAPEPDYQGSWALESDFHIRSATAALIAQVVDCGGHLGWKVINGIACTVTEADQD